MRVLMLDLDTLRPDHLGCYGYYRNTSPAMDSVAADGMRFENYYCADAPCLPSRAGLASGRFGIHTGVINHGGVAADMRYQGRDRGMRDEYLENNFFNVFRKAGMRTASISTFAERHSSFWFNAGFNEIINVGKGGNETADEIIPIAKSWVDAHAEEDDWFLHVHMWDPHTPYRTPVDYENPFADSPMPEWLSTERIDEHLNAIGPHTLQDLVFNNRERMKEYFPKNPVSATTYEEVKELFDAYDCGIKFMDEKIAELIELLKEKGIYDDTAIIITSDHGENEGELGLYGEHGTCDNITTRIPMIIKWPGMQKGVDTGLHYQLDFVPTAADLLGVDKHPKWDGESYAQLLRNGEKSERDYLVLTQCAHVFQRGVRFGDYFYTRTYHDGFYLFPKEMLFNVKEDFHQTHNLAEERPDLCAMACWYLTDWLQENMSKSDSDVDPLWTCLNEGKPLHAPSNLPEYYERLKQTNRAEGADKLRAKYPKLFGDVTEKRYNMGGPRPDKIRRYRFGK